MVCAHVRSIIPSLKIGDYLSVQAHKPCSISHSLLNRTFDSKPMMLWIQEDNSNCKIITYSNARWGCGKGLVGLNSALYTSSPKMRM